jgi:hypothetical protein
MAIRLDIGSGNDPRDGFTGVDLFAEGEGIVKAPMNADEIERTNRAILTRERILPADGQPVER